MNTFKLDACRVETAALVDAYGSRPRPAGVRSQESEVRSQTSGGGAPIELDDGRLIA